MQLKHTLSIKRIMLISELTMVENNYKEKKMGRIYRGRNSKGETRGDEVTLGATRSLSGQRFTSLTRHLVRIDLSDEHSGNAERYF